MSNKNIPLDAKAAEDHLMRFLAVEGNANNDKCCASWVM
jgi:hypothetical protein